MRFYCCLVLVLLGCTAQAQNVDSLFRCVAGKLALSDTAAHSDLFLHINKTLYSANENVWFAAYLMHATNSQAHHTLHVTLLDAMAQRVVSAARFALDQGLASGSFALPDSLPSGQYCLAAYTNQSLLERKPHVFRQPIEVLGLRKAPFTLQLTGLEKGDYLAFTGRISKTESPGAALPPTLGLTLMADGKPYQKLERRISEAGEFQVEVPATLAAKTLEISGTIGSGKEQMAFRRPLTWAASKSILTFFAPSGRVTAGQATPVALSARTTAGQAIAKPCVLLEDDAEIAAFTTDRMGSGLFTFIPKPNKHYLVRFRGELETPIQQFPPIAADTWSIRLAGTVVQDTLRVVVKTPRPAGECLVAIHNTQAMLHGVYLRPRKAETLLKVPVASWAPGIAYVCLYTPDGTLQERRLVFVKAPTPVRAALKTDAATYRPLSEVTLKVTLTSSSGEPVKGVFSFSSCLEQALTAEAKSMAVFNSFERFLSDRLLLPPAAFLATEEGPKAQLLRQERLVDDSTWASLPTSSPGEYDGYVLYNGKQPKKPVDLMLFGSQTALLKSDNAGRFALPFRPLRTNAGKKITLFVVSSNPVGYQLALTAPWARINAALAAQQLLHSS